MPLPSFLSCLNSPECKRVSEAHVSDSAAVVQAVSVLCKVWRASRLTSTVQLLLKQGSLPHDGYDLAMLGLCKHEAT